jgi:hypothetical protein
MNINQIRNKLSSLQPKQKGEKKEKIDMSLYVWKPKTEGKHQIRFVPSPNDFKENEINPFKEVFLHYGIGRFPIYALTNWDEKDPIVEFASKLKTGDFDKDSWKLAGKLEPKLRVFAPIIVRGEEDKGVRLWEINKENYQMLLSIAEDEDYGDYTDVAEGRDFTVTATPAELNGTKYLKCTFQIKPKPSPLSTDAKLVKKWLAEQPNILDLQLSYKKTFEELKTILYKYINPEAEVEESPNTVVSETEDDEEETDLPWKDEKKEEKKPSVSKTTPKSKADKFDALFDEEK